MEITIDLIDEDITKFMDIRSKLSDQDEKKLLTKLIESKRCIVDDLTSLRKIAKKIDVDFHLHEFLERSQIRLPALPTMERSAELEARCEQLRAQAADREYREMTRNVDPVIRNKETASIGEIGREIRSINRHLITLFNMLFTVIGSFVFAYMGTQYLYPSGPGAFASRLIAGLVTATIVFFADLYFVIRTLDETAFDTSATSGMKKSN